MQERLDQRPPGPDEQNHHEQGDALEEREQVVHDAPGLRRPGQPQVVVPDGLEQHGEGLEDQQDRHHVVDVVHLWWPREEGKRRTTRDGDGDT